MRWTIRLLRDADAVDLGDLFLVGAVVAVLGIRLYLTLTGFPRVGGGDLHISHMLYGGFLLLISVFLYATFLDRRVRPIAAVIGGIGFGTFIDEIGKFITADNDYFFKPTAALIYLALIGVYLLVRATQVRRMLAPPDALAQALVLAANAQGGQIDAAARHRALGLLALADQADPLTVALRRYLTGVTPADDTPLARLIERVEGLYARVEHQPWFERALEVIFGLYAVGSIIAAGVLLVLFGQFTASGDVVSVGLVASAIASRPARGARPGPAAVVAARDVPLGRVGHPAVAAGDPAVPVLPVRAVRHPGSRGEPPGLRRRSFDDRPGTGQLGPPGHRGGRCGRGDRDQPPGRGAGARSHSAGRPAFHEDDLAARPASLARCGLRSPGGFRRVAERHDRPHDPILRQAQELAYGRLEAGSDPGDARAQAQHRGGDQDPLARPARRRRHPRSRATPRPAAR